MGHRLDAHASRVGLLGSSPGSDYHDEREGGRRSGRERLDRTVEHGFYHAKQVATPTSVVRRARADLAIVSAGAKRDGDCQTRVAPKGTPALPDSKSLPDHTGVKRSRADRSDSSTPTACAGDPMLQIRESSLSMACAELPARFSVGKRFTRRVTR